MADDPTCCEPKGSAHSPIGGDCSTRRSNANLYSDCASPASAFTTSQSCLRGYVWVATSNAPIPNFPSTRSSSSCDALPSSPLPLFSPSPLPLNSKYDALVPTAPLKPLPLILARHLRSSARS